MALFFEKNSLLFFCLPFFLVCQTQEISAVDTTTTEASAISSTDLSTLSTIEDLISSVTESSIAEATTTGTENATLSVLQKWQKFEASAKRFSKSGIKNLIARLMERAVDLNVSASCRRDVLRLIVGLREIKTWAFSFIDASGKFIDGMLSGTMSALGEYDQCLDIEALENRRGKNFGKVVFTGQYCAIDIKPPLPPKKRYYKLNEVVDELKNFSVGGNIINEAAKAAQFFHFLALRYGICVPSGCSSSDIQEVANSFVGNMQWTANVKRCEVKQDNHYTPLIISVMTVFCFSGFLLLIGSLIETYHYYAQKKVKNAFLQLLVCFSIISNFKRLVNTRSTNDTLSCLHGFRFLSITWIILAHTYLNINYQLFRGLRKATIIQQEFFFQAIVNASVAVDTFFFIGGLLVCYSAVKILRETKKSFNIPLYIIHRLFRLYPVYIVVILFVFLAPILGSGPVYHDTTDEFLKSCYSNWWTNILFINNFVHSHHICLPQSWYISCDIQLYIAALAILLPLFRWPRVGLSIAFTAILASMVGMGTLTYLNDYPPTMLFVHADHEQRVQFWADSYFKPYAHAGPYCIGLMIGYLLATNPKLKFSLCTRFIGWCCAIACNMAVLYGVYDWNTGRDPELVETLLYSSCHRVAWTLGVAWVVVNCAIGQAGVVNYILSWKCWIPLGRLTYAAYLIHPIVQVSAIGNMKMNLLTAHFFAVWIFFGHLMITYGCSFATSMLVEAPFMSLEKMLLRRFVFNPQPKAPGPEDLGHDVGSNKVTENGISSNGITSNGISSNGITSNGISSNGITSNGISSNGITSNGISSNGISSNGITSNGISSNGIANGISLNAAPSNGIPANGIISRL